MPVKRKKIGSGITEREAVDISAPFGVVESKAIRELFDRGFDFESTYGRPIETWARATLSAVGIHEPRKKWSDGREAHGWRGVVRLDGFDVDTPEDYAAFVSRVQGGSPELTRAGVPRPKP